MQIIKIDVTVPLISGSERRLIYLNNKVMGYVSLTNSLRMDTRIRAMIKKYVENYEKKILEQAQARVDEGKLKRKMQKNKLKEQK